jgi:hypothetical protein
LLILTQLTDIIHAFQILLQDDTAEPAIKEEPVNIKRETTPEVKRENSAEVEV